MLFSSPLSFFAAILTFALSILGTVRSQSVAYIYGDVAANGNIPSGNNVAPFHQMLLTDTGIRGCSMLKAVVEAEGFTISQHYDQNTTLDAAFLNQFDVVVFGLHQKVWTAPEKAALDIWLRAGGGIMMYSDSAAGGSFSQVIDGVKNAIGQTAVNSILSAYGMEVTVDQGQGTRAYTSINDESHPLTAGSLEFEGEGVSPVAVDLSSGARVLYPLDSSSQISGGNLNIDTRNITISSPAWAAIALQEIDEGKVIATFDRQPMWNDGEGSSIQKRDNEEILRRIVNYLAGEVVLFDPSEFASLSGSIQTNPEDGLDYLEVSYRRWSGGFGVTGASYEANGFLFRIETNQDLVTPGLWSSGPHLVEEVFPAQGHPDDTETVTVRILQRPSEAPESFARLAIYPDLPSQMKVRAGAATIIGTGGSAVMRGSVSGTGISSIEWSKLSGPGNATFTDITSPTTRVSFSLPGTYRLLLSARNATNEVGEFVDVVVVDSPQVVRAINCGGGPYVGMNGITYEADTLFTDGHIDSFPGNPVVGTDDSPLYNEARSAHSAYNIPVPNGDYLVFFQLAETFFTASGKRIFDVSVEGNPRIENLDLFAHSPGKWVAYDRIVAATVSDGSLDLTFSASVNNALLNAIVVIPY